MIEKILLVRPRGFCAGVTRAIETVKRALDIYGSPIYVRHAIVHNEHVIKDLESRGVIFVEDINDVPNESVVVISAHGAPPFVIQEAKKHFHIIDATCPLVVKVHLEAERYARDGYRILLIGKNEHQEVIGTMGYAPMTLIETKEDIEKLSISSEEKIVYLTQTTLSISEAKNIIEALKKKYPHIESSRKDDICYATQNRQNAVKALCKECDLVLVLGSGTSSNSRQLMRTAELHGVDAHLLSDASFLENSWFADKKILGITSGASVPECLVLELSNAVHSLFPGAKVEDFIVDDEHVSFILPKEVRKEDVSP